MEGEVDGRAWSAGIGRGARICKKSGKRSYKEGCGREGKEQRGRGEMTWSGSIDWSRKTQAWGRIGRGKGICTGDTCIACKDQAVGGRTIGGQCRAEESVETNQKSINNIWI